MRCVYVTDVGNGLCMALCTASNKVIQIDCGSRQFDEKIAFDGLEKIIKQYFSPDIFILSHFHIDHYCGISYANSLNPLSLYLDIKKVYYPRIPDFKEKEDFLCCMFAMNARVFGGETGVMEYDFLNSLRKINHSDFEYESVSQGETLKINGTSFEILWPPQLIYNKTLRVVEQAIKSFKKACEEDKETKRLYEQVKEDGIFREYLVNDVNKMYKYRENIRIDDQQKRKELPEVVQEANRLLRSAANHLSLAFFEDDKLLFLGDTEAFEIKRIVEYLGKKGEKDFSVLITPHHGTHWHKTLKTIKCDYAIASNGASMCFGMRTEFKEISEHCLATFVNGDIMIPIEKSYEPCKNKFCKPCIPRYSAKC